MASSHGVSFAVQRCDPPDRELSDVNTNIVVDSSPRAGTALTRAPISRSTESSICSWRLRVLSHPAPVAVSLRTHAGLSETSVSPTFSEQKGGRPVWGGQAPGAARVSFL